MIDVKSMSVKEREALCQKIRDRILEVVSQNGGHLSSTLGAVELIVAMHAVFDASKDPFIFDVSHQSYPHKLLTDRWDSFESLRQIEGISGFTKPSESPYDYFIAGHSSTSLSLAVGAAKAIKLKGEDRIPVVMIGDGSMTAGMVYEALNEIGEHKYPMVIILNDNEMSIAKPIGAISRYLSKLVAGDFFQNVKQRVEKLLEHLPEGAHYMAKRFEESLLLITPGILFEELGLEYIGPIDGHDLKSIAETLESAKKLKKPVIVHAQTLKGKGYEKAEGYLEHWHGVGPFDIESGKVHKKSDQKSATKVFSEALLNLAQQHDNVVGVTAAMPSGTGIKDLMKAFPDRFWDVAIAEQHAVTSMAALAKEGYKPFVTIYSTFLQRAFDQIIHDVSLMNLPVTFAIDRAGIVGEDGETHQGMFDISYLRMIPGLTLFAPRDDYSLSEAVQYAYTLDHACAFRYPRGALGNHFDYPQTPFETGKSELLKDSQSDILFIGYGNGVNRACSCAEIIQEACDPAVLDLRFVKPLDTQMLKLLSERFSKWFVFSDSAKQGGVGSAIMEALSEKQIQGIKLISLEFDDAHIKHGKVKDVEEKLGLTPAKLAEKVKRFL